MNAEVTQYYNTLQDKDKDGIRYFFDIEAVNQSTGINFCVVSASQNQKKAQGAERFKEVAERMERQKYDILVIKEYAADGTTVVNNFRLRLSSGKGRNRNKNAMPALNNTLGALDNLEQGLDRFGFVNGLAGIMEARADIKTNEFKMQQLQSEISELKVKLATAEQEQKNIQREMETYKERYKEILDEKKDLERDYKYQIQDSKREYERRIHELEQKNTLGSLIVQGGLGFISKNPHVASALGALTSGIPATPTPSAASSNDDDDDEVVVKKSASPEVQKYLDTFQRFNEELSLEQLKQLEIILRYCSKGDNLATLAQEIASKNV